MKKAGGVPLERFVEAFDTGVPLLKPMQAAEAALTAKDESAEASGALTVIESVRVTTPEEFEVAIQMTAEIKAQRAKVEKVRKSFVGPLNDVVMSINKFFRPALDAYDRAEALLKHRAMMFRAEAERERERLLVAAEDAGQQGDYDGADEAIAEAEAAVVPTVKRFSTRTDWTGEVVDADLIPREYLIPDVVKLEAVTRALKKDPQIPGWRAFARTTPIVRQK